MRPADPRSVGELLLDTELIARQVLMDGPDLQAPPMLRTWGEVVQAAGDLWRALPPAKPPMPVTGRYSGGRQPRQGDDVVMGQLQAMTTALHRVTRGRSWPGDGPADERLLRMAENLTRAAELLEKAAPSFPRRPDTRADLAAAKARVMHALYIGSHGVAVAVDNYLSGFDPDAHRRGTSALRSSVRVAQAARSRIGAFEQLAGSYVSRTYPHALDGEHREQPTISRLAQALAGWDVQAHRALAGEPRTAILARVAYTQTLIAAHGAAVLDAGARTGQLAAGQYHTRLHPAMDTTGARWRHTAELWTELTPPSQRHLDPALDVAAGEVRAAFLEIDFDRTGAASPAVMGARTDLPQAGRAVQQALSSSVEIAHVMRELVDDPQLRGAARPVNAMSLALANAIDQDSIDTAPKAALVSPRDIAGNRATALPELVQDACRQDLDATIEACRQAMDAASVLDAPTRRNLEATPFSAGRLNQERTPAAMQANAPSRGCER